MNILFQQRGQPASKLAVPLQYSRKNDHHEATCPICKHLNILADEADVCEHFISIEERQDNEQTRINWTILLIVISAGIAAVAYPLLALKVVDIIRHLQ